MNLRKHSRKSVSFGPMLSSEFIDKKLPPNTPIKRGSIPSFDLTLQCLMETPNENDDNNTAMNTPTRFPSPRRHLVTPLYKEIEENNPRLRNTKRTLPTPLRNAIKAAPLLKQALPTPVPSEKSYPVKTSTS